MRKSEKPFMVEFSGTPEAGKTTAINAVVNMLERDGYKTIILEESAGKLPVEIPKGIFDANLWMHYITQAGILKACYTTADVVLIDRGIIDSQFYAWKFYQEKMVSKQEYSAFQKQCLEGVNPDLFLGLMVSPKLAVTRRGGEGRIVNEGYIEKYNKFFIEYFDRIQLTKGLIRTDKINVLEINNKVYDTILKVLKK